MIRRLFVPVLMLWATLVPGWSATTDEVILQIEILSDDGLVDRTHQLTETDLRAMTQVQLLTTTPWTEGIQSFQGVSLQVVLATLQVTEGKMYMYAVNDYMVEVPLSDAAPDGPIIAYEINGKLMSLREKGPLWLVYPYDSKPEFRSETVYSRSIWQLNRIEITP